MITFKDKNRSKNRAFTLIELLVVISIIGLLSSIVSVATKGVRDKARIAKSLQFDSSIKHAQGDSLIGEWTFDVMDGSTIVKDTSGNNKDGFLQNNAQITQNSSGIIGEAVELDGINQYVEVPDFHIGEFKAMTITAWVNLRDTKY